MDLGRLGEDAVEVEEARSHPLGQAQSGVRAHLRCLQVLAVEGIRRYLSAARWAAAST
jgi:hypothetical protein